MSNITVPVPNREKLKELGGNTHYDKSYLRDYYTKTRYIQEYGTYDAAKHNSEHTKYFNDFDKWLKDNFIKNPGFLKQPFKVDDDYKPIYSDTNGRYYQFNESELEYGTFGYPGSEITNDDIIHDYGKSLKDELKAKGQALVKVSNGKWRVYLNGSSAPSSGTSNIASTTSTDSNTSTTSSTTSSTDSAPSTSNTSTTSSTTGSSSTSRTNRTNSTIGTGSTSSISSTTNTSSTTDASSTTSTDSTTRSFDFLDDVLGTKNKDNEDKPTEIDPNQVANTIVSETKLNDDAISSLVSTYLNSLHKINRSYNTQTK